MSCVVLLVVQGILFSLVSLGFLSMFLFAMYNGKGNCIADYIAKVGASGSNCIYFFMAGLSREVVGSIRIVI